jgi:magnesium-transporting ATPase (P-type)
MHSKQSNAGTRWAALCILAIVCGSHLPSAEALVREPAAPAAARAPAGPVPGGQRLSLSRGLRSPNKQFLRGGETLIDPELGATAHMKQPADVLKMAGVDPKVGLSEERVAEIRAIFGSNVLPSKEKVPLWKRFLEQFDDKMVKILLAAAGISTVFAVVDYGTEAHPFVEPAVIMSILILNAVIGVWQESSAEAAIDALATFNPDQAKVQLRTAHPLLGRPAMHGVVWG